jgi:DNA (cytosine-5)-methyltransferase 1
VSNLIPVIDLFAGPGGLGEGFSSVKDSSGKYVFDVRLSIEKDCYAHETLKLRTFFRLLSRLNPSGLCDYYSFLKNEIRLKDLYDLHTNVESIANERAWKTELGENTPITDLRKRINIALHGRSEFVLIGGPPCQAYSLVGRSRNKGNSNYNPNDDKRQTLYKEYLQILADHQPAVFVMENVKGLLSAKLDDELVLEKIINDLKNPSSAVLNNHRNISAKGLGYRLFSFVNQSQVTDDSFSDFIIQSEKFGIPQQRHRVIILGIREDYPTVVPEILEEQEIVNFNTVIDDLPRLRSGLSKSADSGINWISTLKSVISKEWYKKLAQEGNHLVAQSILQTVEKLDCEQLSRGSLYLKWSSDKLKHIRNWYIDDSIKGVCNHETRSHIAGDLHRYLFSASYAYINGHSPTLSEFPIELLPNHRNAKLHDYSSKTKPIFGDRFRVQVYGRPATTITSHISKDGHYYIHPDPSQCRSLTVREAARIQTFPDNYYFCGPRTSQYCQVGNAVPPFLAFQLAQIVHQVLYQMGVCEKE